MYLFVYNLTTLTTMEDNDRTTDNESLQCGLATVICGVVHCLLNLVTGVMTSNDYRIVNSQSQE